MVREDCGRHLRDALFADDLPYDGRRKRLRRSWEELLASRMYFGCSAGRSILPILPQAARPQESEDRDAGGLPILRSGLGIWSLLSMLNNAEPFRVNRVTPSDLTDFCDQPAGRHLLDAGGRGHDDARHPASRTA
ncbi:MAG: hypothetical protein ACLP9L_10855 [Thermoguttaceae bacterium]